MPPGCSALTNNALELQNPHSQSGIQVMSSERFLFSKNQRLLNSENFSTVFNDAPLKASHTHFLILARKNSQSQPRLGLVIAKKHVRRAADRNLIKRIARESFRLQQHKIAPIDAIVLARRGAAAIPATELRKIFNGLWKRINTRAQNT